MIADTDAADVQKRFLEVFADRDEHDPYLAQLLTELHNGRAKQSILADLREAAVATRSVGKTAQVEGWRNDDLAV